MPYEYVEALMEPVHGQDDLAIENKRLREAIVVSRAEITFALCFKEFGPVRHMLESVIATLQKALERRE